MPHFLDITRSTPSLSACPCQPVAAISPVTITILTGTTWFPTTLAHAFMPSLRISFYIGALLSVIAAVLASMTGSRFVHELQGKEGEKEGKSPETVEDTGLDITG